MPRFQQSVVIDRPPAEVFAFATDLDAAGAWMPDIVKIEPLTDGPIGEGYRWKETRRCGKREGTAELEIREHRGPGAGGPPYVHAAGNRMMGVDSEYRFTFAEANGGGTKVDLDATIKGVSLLGKVMAGPFKKMIEKQDHDLLERLKAAVETG
ncbi:MAG: SRPBCC family protein [Planctomycetota bacterium]|nr:SRPBCC family protein [Planctomycetota bacterium]